MYNELNKTLTHIIEKVDASNIIQVLTELSTLYTQVISDSTSETNDQIAQSHQLIIEAQNEIEPSSLDVHSVRILRKFDSEHVLGVPGIQTLETKLSTIRNNPRAVTTTLQEFAAQIKAVRDKAQTALTSMDEIFEKSTELPVGEGSLQIVFEGSVSVDTFRDLEVQAKFWAQIINLSKLIIPPTADGEVIITSIHKSSPASITIKGKLVYLSLIAHCFFWGLNIKGVLLSHEEVKSQIRLNNITAEEKEKILSALEVSASKTLDQKIEEATDSVMQSNEAYITDSANKNVAHSSCRQIIKNLYNFSISGGHVSIVDGKPEDSTQAELYNLEQKYQELEELKDKLNVEALPEAKFSKDETESILSETITEVEGSQDNSNKKSKKGSKTQE